MTTTVKHAFRQNEKIITTYGTVELDERGYVKNLEDLDCSEEQLLEVPNFINGAAFKAKPADAREPIEGQQTSKTDDNVPSDDDYANLIKELIEGGAKVNSEDYIDMEVLNGKLREKKWPIISGTKRKELQDLSKKPPELKQDGPTVEAYVKAGYSAKNYPPAGYASKSTEEEIAAAIKAEEEGKGNDANENDGDGQGTGDGSQQNDSGDGQGTGE